MDNFGKGLRRKKSKAELSRALLLLIFTRDKIPLVKPSHALGLARVIYSNNDNGIKENDDYDSDGDFLMIVYGRADAASENTKKCENTACPSIPELFISCHHDSVTVASTQGR